MDRKILIDRDLLILYHRETGNSEPVGSEISVYRSRGRWILDCSDEEVMEEIGYTGIVEIPDLEYFIWLQNKCIELLNHTNKIP